MKVVEYMHEYIIKEPFTVEVTKTNYGIDVAMDKYVLTKVCEYGERLSLERIVRCRDCRYFNYIDKACERVHWPLPVSLNDFCAWGKERHG